MRSAPQAVNLTVGLVPSPKDNRPSANYGKGDEDMGIFNDAQPGDIVTLEMRIKEGQRHMLQAMFVSDEENKKLLQEA